MKLLGLRTSMKKLEPKFQSMWVRSGVILVVDLHNDFYVVKLSS